MLKSLVFTLMTILPEIAIELCGNDFLLPYIQQLFPMPEGKSADDIAAPVAGVKITTECSSAPADNAFDEYCEAQGIPVVAIHCPYVVGTAMNGLTRRIAAAIYSGRYVQIRDNKAAISLIHAEDVAQAVKQSAGMEGSYVLTDGAETPINSLADALAHRIDNKRLFTIALRWARWWYGKDFFTQLTTDHLFASTLPGFAPRNTIELLYRENYY